MIHIRVARASGDRSAALGEQLRAEAVHERVHRVGLPRPGPRPSIGDHVRALRVCRPPSQTVDTELHRPRSSARASGNLLSAIYVPRGEKCVVHSTVSKSVIRIHSTLCQKVSCIVYNTRLAPGGHTLRTKDYRTDPCFRAASDLPGTERKDSGTVRALPRAETVIISAARSCVSTPLSTRSSQSTYPRFFESTSARKQLGEFGAGRPGISGDGRQEGRHVAKKTRARAARVRWSEPSPQGFRLSIGARIRSSRGIGSYLTARSVHVGFQ